jgi:hypothetical protein
MECAATQGADTQHSSAPFTTVVKAKSDSVIAPTRLSLLFRDD